MDAISKHKQAALRRLFRETFHNKQHLFASFTDSSDSQEIVYYRNTTGGGDSSFTRVGPVYTSPNAPAASVGAKADFTIRMSIAGMSAM